MSHSRARKLALWLGAALLLTAAVLGFLRARAPRRYEASFFGVFDTYTQIVLYSSDEQSAAADASRFHDELLAYHQLYDIYHNYPGVNNLKTINDQAGKSPVPADERIIQLLSEAKRLHRETGGKMNVAMGSVLELWQGARSQALEDPENARIPDMAELQSAAMHTNIDDIVIDEAAGTVYLRDPMMRLDVGAIAKGYAVERVCQSMEARGVSSALISAGGNVRAIGARADGTPWRVNLQNPDLEAKEQSLMTLPLKGQSLVSSGSYQRYFTVDGQVYHHIIDPETLMPAQYFWAVSVLANDSGLADALSTALYNMPLKAGQALAQKFPGVQALWVHPDGKQTLTEGFPGEPIPENEADPNP